jgi:hypothetical protein
MMNDVPWIFPSLINRRWAWVGLDALARAEFPDNSTTNPLNDPWFCDDCVRKVAARLGVDHSWGGWLEDRSHLWRGHYLPPGCAVHLGIDLNVPTGTPVLTPLSGRVIHAMPCQALGGGWGGWFVLRADIPRCGAAYLLFGHLAHRGLPPQGARLTEGSQVGVIGTPNENGGWYPHLHLQALSIEAWEAVQHAPDTLLDGYGCPAATLDRRFPDPAPLVMVAGCATAQPTRNVVASRSAAVRPRGWPARE